MQISEGAKNIMINVKEYFENKKEKSSSDNKNSEVNLDNLISDFYEENEEKNKNDKNMNDQDLVDAIRDIRYNAYKRERNKEQFKTL